MSVERRSIDLAWPSAWLACALAALACGDDAGAPFVTGGNRDGRDGGSDDERRDGGNSGEGGSGGLGLGGSGGTNAFTEDQWVPGDPTGLDPDKVYVIVEEGDLSSMIAGAAYVLDLAHPGGDPAKDTGRKMLSQSNYGQAVGTLPINPRTRLRADGALLHRTGNTSLSVVNNERGDIKIAKCVIGGDDYWAVHPTLGSVIYQCRDEENYTRLWYHSIKAIGNADYYREFVYPIPTDYRPLVVAPDGDLLLRKRDECEGSVCPEFHVAHDDELIAVPLPSPTFYSRLFSYRNIEGGFGLLVHAENFYDVPPLPAVIPEPPDSLPPIFYAPAAFELWEITYEGEMSKVYDYVPPAFIANNCRDEPEQVIYPEHPIWLGYMDYTQQPFRRSVDCNCTLAYDGSAVCNSYRQAHFMNLDGTGGPLHVVEPDPGTTGNFSSFIEALVTGP